MVLVQLMISSVHKKQNSLVVLYFQVSAVDGVSAVDDVSAVLVQ